MDLNSLEALGQLILLSRFQWTDEEAAYFPLEEKDLTVTIDTLNRAVAIISKDMQTVIISALTLRSIRQRLRCCPMPRDAVGHFRYNH